MALTIKPNQPKVFTYVPISERDDDKPFSVKLRRLPLDILARIQDSSLTITEKGNYEININTQNLEALRYGLINWENITDENDNILEIKKDSKGLTSLESIEYIPSDIRTEIANIIINISKNPTIAPLLLQNDKEA